MFSFPCLFWLPPYVHGGSFRFFRDMPLFILIHDAIPVKETHPMTEKELRKLNRYQLLELLIMQTKRADELQAQLEQAQQELESREIQMESIGSIAEASIQVSGILEAAQNAADLFLNAARQRTEELEREKTAEAALITENAQAEAKRILANARQEAAWILSYAKERSDDISKEVE